MAVKLKKLYEGKAKIIYAKTSKEVIATYKNDATAFNNLKKGSIKNKGCLLYTSPSPRDPVSSRMPSSA